MSAFFDKAVMSLHRFGSTVGSAFGSFVRKARINAAAAEAQRSKEGLFRNLGELLYNMQQSGAIDLDRCVGICDEITAVSDKIEECQNQLAMLENGGRNESEPVLDKSCPCCGAMNDSAVYYCSACGEPLIEELGAFPE